MTREVETISRRYQNEPRRCVVAPEAADIDAVTHLFWRAERTERLHITARLIERHGRAFVFCRTKRGADRVARQLRAAGVSAAAIHGDRTQPQRARALASFSVGETHALVATDVMARGIHVDAVPCVVHFDQADDTDTYIHRSGRTGRTGETGTVVSLVPGERRADIHSLQHGLGLRPILAIPFSEETATLPRRPGNGRAEPPVRRDVDRRTSGRVTRRPSTSSRRRQTRRRSAR